MSLPEYEVFAIKYGERGWIVLASDAAHYYESITDGNVVRLDEPPRG